MMTRGSYCMVMRLDRETRIPVGKKPPVDFPAGFYCYVGSAMNSLEKRICRHRSREKKKHWHIDYFLDHARIVDIKEIESNTKQECGINSDVAEMADETPFRGFGSSDCRNCKAHLHLFREDPSDRLDRLVEKWKGSSETTKE